MAEESTTEHPPDAHPEQRKSRPVRPASWKGMPLFVKVMIGAAITAIIGMAVPSHSEDGCVRYTPDEERTAIVLSVLLAPIGGVLGALYARSKRTRSNELGSYPGSEQRLTWRRLALHVVAGSPAGWFVAFVFTGFASGNC